MRKPMIPTIAETDTVIYDAIVIGDEIEGSTIPSELSVVNVLPETNPRESPIAPLIRNVNPIFF